MNDIPNPMNLEELLENVSVHYPCQWENDTGPKGWFAVSTDFDGGIIAYFQYKKDAYRFRLDYINRKLNG